MMLKKRICFLLLLLLISSVYVGASEYGFEDEPWHANASGVTVSLSNLTVFTGRSSLEVSFSGIDPKGGVVLTPPSPLVLPGIPDKLGLYLNGAVNSLTIILEDPQGKEYPVQLGGSAGGQWQRLEISAKDFFPRIPQAISLPLEIREIRLQPKEAEGIVYLDNLFSQDLICNYLSLQQYEEKDSVDFRYDIETSTPLEFSFQLLKEDMILRTEKLMVSSRQAGKLSMGKILAGEYKIQVSASYNQLLFNYPQARVLVQPNRVVTNQKPYFGVQTHFGHELDIYPDTLDLVYKSGVDMIRDEVFWAEVERERGVFVFPKLYDDYIFSAASMGLRPLITLDFGNPIYGSGAPETPEALAAWERYVTKVVERYHSVVKHWEVWNEFNIGMGLSLEQKSWSKAKKAEVYTEILEVTYRAIKRVDPKAMVLGCANSGADPEFVSMVIANGGLAYMDAISIHPYIYWHTDPSPSGSAYLSLVQERVELIGEMVRAKGGSQTVWITELGWPTNLGAEGHSEIMQAAYLTQLFTKLAQSKIVEAVFWYNFQDKGTNELEREHNFGLIKRDLSLKPGYVALSNITRILRQGNVELEAETNTLLYSIEDSFGHKTYIAWAKTGTSSVLIPANGKYTIKKVDGEVRVVDVAEEGLLLTVDESPVIVAAHSEKIPQKTAKVRFNANPAVLGEEITISLDFSPGEAMIQIYNMAGTSVMQKKVSLTGGTTDYLWSTRNTERGLYLVQIIHYPDFGKSTRERKLLLIL